jgi:hypothetical protein
MFWIILISLFVVVLGKFFWDRARMGRRVLKVGGMRTKYKAFIDLILDQNESTVISHENSTSLTLYTYSPGVHTYIELLMTFKSTVTVSYRLVSELFGNHKLTWEFSEDEDPEFMLHKINTEIGEYLNNQNLTL